MKDIKEAGLEKSIVQKVVNWKSPADGHSKLHTAASDGNNEEVRDLLSIGAKINARMNNGATPLHCAVGSGHKDTVVLLLSKGANVNLKDMNRNTPLHYAVTNNDKEIVKILIAHGANVNTKNMSGLTPLGIVTELSFLQNIEDIADFLRKHGAK